MSKRIFKAIWLVALLVFVAMLIFIMGLMYEYTSNMLMTQLKAETDLAAHGVEHEGIGYINDLQQRDYRITWIAADGRVLYDSESDTAGMENHLEREEVREALTDAVSAVVDAIRSTLETMPPELSADIIDNGIMLTGGGALLRGLDTLISRETGMPVHVAENPLDCVVLGTAKRLEADSGFDNYVFRRGKRFR